MSLSRRVFHLDRDCTLLCLASCDRRDLDRSRRALTQGATPLNSEDNERLFSGSHLYPPQPVGPLTAYETVGAICRPSPVNLNEKPNGIKRALGMLRPSQSCRTTEDGQQNRERGSRKRKEIICGLSDLLSTDPTRLSSSLCCCSWPLQ